MEVFSPVRINEVAATFGLIAGASLDLLAGWDLSDKKQQAMVWEILERDEPEVVVASPPVHFVLHVTKHYLGKAQLEQGVA